MILRAARRADHKLESLFVGCIQISAYRRGFFYGCKFLFSRVLKIIVKNNRFFSVGACVVRKKVSLLHSQSGARVAQTSVTARFEETQSHVL